MPLAGCAAKAPALAQSAPTENALIEQLKPLQGAAQNGVKPWNGTIQSVPYHWRMANEGGGGNTSGFAISPVDSNVMFVQSGDTGGYRWNAEEKRWIQFSDWNSNVNYGDLVGLAVDPKNKDVVYYAAGFPPDGDVFKSVDGGKTWAVSQMKAPDGKPPRMQGREDSSTLGPRLSVDPNNSEVIYYAARYDGLFRTLQGSAPGTWSHVAGLNAHGATTRLKDGKEMRDDFDKQGGLAWVLCDPSGGTVQVEGVAVSKIIYVSVVGDYQGLTPQSDGGIYRSEDGGQSFAQIAGPKRSSRGSIADDGTLIFSSEGKVWRLKRGAGAPEDLGAPAAKRGYNAVAVFPGDSSRIVAMRYGLAPREYSVGEENRIVSSLDGGKSWRELKDVKYEGAAAWWNWFGSWAHWMTFDPRNPKVVWLGDWANPWKCDDITASAPVFREINRGKSGSYVNGIVTPPAVAGASIAPVFTTGADWAGFRLVSLSVPPRVHITQSEGRFNGIADGTGIAFCESDPNFVAAVGGWDHGVNGGGGASTDNGRTWAAFAVKGLDAPGFKGDPKLGRVAVGATKGANGYPIIVWTPRFAVPRFSLDWGQTWTQSKGAPSGVAPSEWDSWQPLAADPLDGQTFYLFNNNENKNGGFGEVFRTLDGGANWQRMGGVKYGWNGRKMAWFHLRAQPGKSGELWLSLHDPWDGDQASGLYHSSDAGASWTKAVGFSEVASLAFGAPASGQTNPSMVVAGKLNGELGIYASDDATIKTADLSDASWKQVWQHQPGGGNYADSMAVLRGLKMIGADRQQHGRLYSGSVGTGRSMYYGDPDSASQSAPDAPTNLEGRASYGQVRLYWTDTMGAQKYNLYRSTDAKSSGQIIGANLRDSGYLDEDFAPETRYFYRVEAVNAKGKSAPSRIFAAMPYYKVKFARAFGSAGLNAETFDKASDGDLNTAFDAAAASGGFTGVELSKPMTISRVRYQPRQWAGKRMVGGKFQVAPAQSGPWRDVYTIETEPPNGAWSEADLPAPATGKFFRYLGPDEGHANIKEFELYSGGSTDTK